MHLHGRWLRAPDVDKIYCAPGNAGIAEYAECVPMIGHGCLTNWLHSQRNRKIDLDHRRTG